MIDACGERWGEFRELGLPVVEDAVGVKLSVHFDLRLAGCRDYRTSVD
jgi:hypothetical protein